MCRCKAPLSVFESVCVHMQYPAPDILSDIRRKGHISLGSVSHMIVCHDSD